MNKTGVYTITNLINGKIYIGSTTQSFDVRKKEHFKTLNNRTHSNKYLQRSYNKYGCDNFKFEILEEHDPEQCIGMETYWINLLNTRNPKIGYNIQIPGCGMMGLKHSQKTKDIISVVQKGKKRSPCKEETKSKISAKLMGHVGAMRGIPRTDETKAKISLANLGKKRSAYVKERCREIAKNRVFSEATRKKMSILNTGKKMSDSAKRKMSESAKSRNQKPPSRKGKRHSDESKKKMSIGHLNKKHSVERSLKKSIYMKLYWEKVKAGILHRMYHK